MIIGIKIHYLIYLINEPENADALAKAKGHTMKPTWESVAEILQELKKTW